MLCGELCLAQSCDGRSENIRPPAFEGLLCRYFDSSGGWFGGLGVHRFGSQPQVPDGRTATTISRRVSLPQEVSFLDDNHRPKRVAKRLFHMPLCGHLALFRSKGRKESRKATDLWTGTIPSQYGGGGGFRPLPPLELSVLNNSPGPALPLPHFILLGLACRAGQGGCNHKPDTSLNRCSPRLLFHTRYSIPTMPGTTPLPARYTIPTMPGTTPTLIGI